MRNQLSRTFLPGLFVCVICCASAFAQTTAFTYQGKLIDGGTSPTATYEMQFKVFDAASSGNQQPQPTPVTLDFTVAGGNAVSVTNGSFSVSLNFGGGVFTGADRFLEISVRHNSSESFVPLSPRQQIASNPYAIRSANSGAAESLSNVCVLCVTDGQIQSIAGSKVTGAVANATNAATATTAGNVSGVVAIANGGTGSATKNFVDLSSNQTVGGNKTFTGNGLFNGNIGIGTNAPSAPLHINGPGGPAPAGQPIGQNGLLLGTNGDASYKWIQSYGGALSINPQGNNVGIGTNAPSEMLEVSGNARVSGKFLGNGAIPWQVVQGNSNQAQPNNGYLATNDAQVVVTLPPNPNIGDVVRVSSLGSGGWKIVQNAGQSIINNSGKFITNWIPRENARAWSSVVSSADGSKLVAVTTNAQIYTSTDSGVTWTARETNRQWSAVASSADGMHLVATVYGGQIHTSSDSGLSWTPRENNRGWVSVASSADGSKLAAVDGGLGCFNPCPTGGRIYTSTDFGATWTPRENNRQWYSIASSADGSKLVAVAPSTPSAFTSTDFGVTWTQQSLGVSGHLTSVASSADGSKLIAGDHFPGYLYTSTDSGVSWTQRESARVWQAVASSADGTKLVAVVENGRIYTSIDSGETWTERETDRDWFCVASSADGSKLVAVVLNGKIYTSSGTFATSTGTDGYLRGRQFSSVELQYIGNGRFMALSHEGTISGN